MTDDSKDARLHLDAEHEFGDRLQRAIGIDVVYMELCSLLPSEHTETKPGRPTAAVL